MWEWAQLPVKVNPIVGVKAYLGIALKMRNR
jgi:hypothetical protein